MEIGKLPILDEKLEMACDKGHIYLCQYFESNQWEEELNRKLLKQKTYFKLGGAKIIDVVLWMLVEEC